MSDDVLIKFDSVNSALIWAVEMATRPNIKSTSFFKSMYNQFQKKHRKNDYIEYALTILRKVNVIENKLQLDLVRSIYYQNSVAMISLSSELSEKHSINSVLFFAAILNSYVATHFGKVLTMNNLEKIVGLKKGELKKHKKELRKAESIVFSMIASGENKIELILNELGVI